MVSNKKKNVSGGSIFETAAIRITNFTGSTTAFICASGAVLLWLVVGPFFDYSDSWQLVINTGTTIVTFLMVFVIQRSQNKESLAVQLKLNEIIASIKGASNSLIDAEDLSEKELQILKTHYDKLSGLFGKDNELRNTHSVERAEVRHKEKQTKK